MFQVITHYDKSGSVVLAQKVTYYSDTDTETIAYSDMGGHIAHTDYNEFDDVVSMIKAVAGRNSTFPLLKPEVEKWVLNWIRQDSL